MINQKQWESLKRQIYSAERITASVARLLGQAWPMSDSEISFKVETTTFDESYLSFLQEQIELGARGKKWTDVLEKRKQALDHYVDQPLTRISLTSPSVSIVVKIRPIDQHLVLFEAFENDE